MERYSDRMIRPEDDAPRVAFVRERNRLIPIPVGSAATVPPATARDGDLR